MKHIVRPNIVITAKSAKELPQADPPVSDISIQRLIDDGLLVLYREVRNLKMLSVNGKLQPADSRDLRDSIKLLFELKDRENESLRGLTDEELTEQAKALLQNEQK